jgi:hypothetical protein
MKRLHLISLCALAISALLCRAEDQPAPLPPGGADGERPSLRRFNGERPPMDGEYLERWLESLKQRSPEEYERAQKMMKENPDEFRKHLHQKLQEMKARGGGQSQPGGSIRERPRVMEALKQLPQEDRDWAMQRLQQQFPHYGGRGDGFSEFRHPNPPEFQQNEERVREFVRKFRDGKTDDEKKAAKKELREHLGVIFDQREKLRGDSLKMMEEKIAKLRQQMEERQRDRDKLIDARLDEVIQYPPAPSQP